jgi:hypothetical protein
MHPGDLNVGVDLRFHRFHKNYPLSQYFWRSCQDNLANCAASEL